MKTLVLVRHAESGWAAGQDDIDRTLTDVGKTDAAHMASLLKTQQIVPDRFYTSNATRARQTADIFLKVLQVNTERLVVDNSLYEPRITAFYRAVEETPDDVHSLIIFSHNPGISTFVNDLDCYPDVDMPACGMFALKAETTEWKNFRIVEKSFLFYHIPRQW